MKKILFLLMALVCNMSVNAQIMKIMKGNALKAIYTQEEADNVVFEKVNTIGTAKATINGNEVDVEWVQLWTGGPKFATHNVGAVDITDRGTYMTFTDAAKTGNDYVWGANWCTPSKEDMEHLLTAASGQDDDKVSCEYIYIHEDGVCGFNYTGKDEGYTNCSVFFPASQYEVSETNGVGVYMTRTPSTTSVPLLGNLAWYLRLYRNNNQWESSFLESSQAGTAFVRPVLKD